MSANHPTKFLMFPWSFAAITVLILISVFEPKWASENWNWLALILIVPAAILENLKSGYSSITMMYAKILYTCLTFFIVGAGLGIWIYCNNYTEHHIAIPGYSFGLAGIIILIDLANIFSMLKAAKREGFFLGDE